MISLRPNLPETRLAPLDTIGRWVEAARQDLAHAVRGLRLRPGFTATVVITLALGIGANATMFGVLDRLLLRAPAHITDPDRVVQIYTRQLASPTQQVTQPYAVYPDFLRNVPAFANVAASTTSFSEPSYYPLGRGADAGRVIGAQVTPSYFPLLGVQPLRGHFFKEDEAGESNPQKLAVLGYTFWQRHFGGVDAAIGQTIDLGTDRYTVVGVAPKGFTGTGLIETDVFIPIAAADGLRFIKRPDWNTTRSSQWMTILARLKPGVQLADAESQATTAFQTAEKAQVTTDNDRGSADSIRVGLASIVPGKAVRPFAADQGANEVRVAELLGAVALAVLLIACANVANLLLVRGLGRRREIAVRLALGISRGRLLGQLLMEGMLLSLLGAVGALVAVFLGSGLIQRLLLGQDVWTGQIIDGRMLAFTMVATLATGLLTSLFPALKASRADLNSALKTGSRSGAVSRSAARTALLAGQAALAVVLLVGSGLFVRALRDVAELEVGVDVNRILVVGMKHTSVGMSNTDAREAFRVFTERAREVPGITSAATSIAHSFGVAWGTIVSIPGRELPAEQGHPTQYAITPDYFAVMGVRILAGRGFTEADRAGSEPVVVINQTAAKTYWPGANPIGQCVQLGGDTMPCNTVVGIVSNSRRQALIEGPTTQIYRSLDQVRPEEYERPVSIFGFTLLARTSGNPATLAEPLRRALQASYPGVPYLTVMPLADRVGRQSRSWSLGATMFTIFGSLALLIAVVGLYSVVRFTLAERHREFGVRVALGATSTDLIRSAVLRGVLPAAGGIGLGLLIALLASRVLQGLLLDVSPRDPLVFATAALGLLAASAVACLVPSLRLSRVDPMVVLREE